VSNYPNKLFTFKQFKTCAKKLKDKCSQLTVQLKIQFTWLCTWTNFSKTDFKIHLFTFKLSYHF